MSPTDKNAFFQLIAGCLKEIYEKPCSPAQIGIWFNVLRPYSLPEIQAALADHLSDPVHGQFPPRPANLIYHLDARHPDHGHPEPEEAWALLADFVSHEEKSGILTEEIREAWRTCSPLLEMGDTIAARMAFLETYRKALNRAKQAGTPPKWTLTLGTDLEGRKRAIAAALEASRISTDYAATLLPKPAATLNHLAGLITGPNTPEFIDRAELSARFKLLATQLRSGTPTPHAPA